MKQHVSHIDPFSAVAGLELPSPEGTTRRLSSESSSECPPPKTRSKKPFQATVEDCDGSESGSVDADSAGSLTRSQSNLQSSSPISVTASHRSNLQSLYDPGSDNDPVLKDTSTFSPPKQSPTRVRFSPHTSTAKICHSSGSEEGERPRQNSSRPRVKENKKRCPELSPVDLKWGRLFDGQSKPTERLHKIYRGVANYVVSIDPVLQATQADEELS